MLSSPLLMASPSWFAGSLYRVERLGGVAWSAVPTSNRFVCCAQSWRFLALVCLRVHCTLYDGRVLLFDHVGSWLTTEPELLLSMYARIARCLQRYILL
jgi:hypothetical protein